MEGANPHTYQILSRQMHVNVTGLHLPNPTTHAGRQVKGTEAVQSAWKRHAVES